MLNGYYAYDMINGKTIIGKSVPQGNRITDGVYLEDVIVTETLSSRLTMYNSTNNVTSSSYKYIDIPEEYAKIYRDIKSHARKLPNIRLPQTDNSSSAKPIHCVLEWYLGEDILKEEKKIKGNI